MLCCRHWEKFILKYRGQWSHHLVCSDQFPPLSLGNPQTARRRRIPSTPFRPMPVAWYVPCRWMSSKRWLPWVSKAWDGWKEGENQCIERTSEYPLKEGGLLRSSEVIYQWEFYTCHLQCLPECERKVIRGCCTWLSIYVHLYSSYLLHHIIPFARTSISKKFWTWPFEQNPRELKLKMGPRA